MRFQFIFRHPGCLRIFDSTLRGLADAGHDIQLLFNLRGDRVGHDLTKILIADYPQISHESAPIPRGQMAVLVNLCVVSIDWLRYKDPRYQDAPKLTQRAMERLSKAGPSLQLILNFVVKVVGWKRAILFLQWLLKGLPVDKAVHDFLLNRPCDLIIISPLVDIGSEQIEYLRAAKLIGRRTALLVHSWDNLTNKGLIRIIPDRVLVWNPAQREEAISMHGVPPQRIFVTGAQCYDVWYNMKPVESREAFCERVGLDPSQPFVLYVGSSAFIGAGTEPDLVSELHQIIINYPAYQGKSLQILVRPHPQNAVPWERLESTAGLVVYPRGGELPVQVSARLDYYHSLYHACAVVGVNTSAMIEASILGRPVLTILDPRFHETQLGTLHFHHLLQGSHLITAASLDDLTAMLYQAAEGSLAHEAATRRFLGDFVRPYGPQEAGTTKVIAALSDQTNQVAPKPLSMFPTLWVARALGFCFLPVATHANRVLNAKRALKQRKIAPTTKSSDSIQGLKKPSVKKPPSTEQLVRKPWKDVSSAREVYISVIKSGESDLIQRLRRECAGEPVIIGPWLSELGFEILYWAPFVQWLTQNGVFDPKHAMLVTRGGAEVWYPGLNGSVVNLYTMYDLEKFKQMNENRITEIATQKHIKFGAFDTDIVSRIQNETNRKYSLLHPKEMYIYLQPLLAGKGGRAPMEMARRVLIHDRLTPPSQDLMPHLPKRYVAVKFYYRSSFPATVENQQFVARTLAEICARHQVVLLNTRMEFDDHEECDADTQANLHRIDDLMTPNNNLAVQSAVIARADAFFGTYGGLSYVPLFYGVPSFAFRSSEEGLNLVHLHLANEISHKLEVPFHLFHTRDYSLIREMVRRI